MTFLKTHPVAFYYVSNFNSSDEYTCDPLLKNKTMNQNKTVPKSKPTFLQEVSIKKLLDSMQPPKYNMCPLTWSRKNWIIVSFSSLEFIPQVKIWYKQMTNLGYKSHHIVSLDKESYRILCKNPDYRVISGFEGDLPIGTEKKARNTRLQSIWRIRYGVLLRLLSLGYNVFISDSDSIWKKYVDLDLLDVASFDMFHSVGGDLPMSTYKVWGHVLAGGVGGYTSKYRNSVGIYQIQLEI